MKTTDLIAEIEAYAAAKASGNVLLARRQGGVLQGLLGQLPEELPEREVKQEHELTNL